MLAILRPWAGRARVIFTLFFAWAVALVGLFVTAPSARAASDLDLAFDADVRSFGRTTALAYQPDGKILAGGLFTSAGGGARTNLARFNADGSLDHSFLVGTNLNGSVRAIAVQSDGKLLIAGGFTAYGATAINRVARLNADGTLDPTFAPGTGFDAEVLDLALQSDGKVIAVGVFTTFNGTARNRVARLNANGSLDTTFLASGAAANGIVWDVALQSDGKPVIAGAFTTYNGTARNRLARLTTAGALDTTIAFTGGANNDIYSLALDGSGRFVIGGLFTTWNGTARKYIARLTTAGAVDTTFDPGTTSFDNVVVKVALDSAGRVFVAGRMRSFNGTALPAQGLARLTPAGAADAAFAPAEGSVLLARERFAEALLVNAADGVIVGGSLFEADGTGALAALTATGAPEVLVDFGRGLEFTPVVNAVRPGRDGKYWVVGEFDWIGGAARPGVARFLANARIDPDFVPREGFGNGAYFNAPVTDGVELPNGNFWVFGAFTAYGVAYDRPGAALFSSGGFPEITSTELTITGGTVRRALLGSDGKVTLAGTFTSVTATARAGVARVLTTGALDAAFAPGSGPAGGTILDADLDADGRLLVAGSFTSFSGTAESFLARLSATGAVDAAFAGNTNVSAAINSVQALPGGKTLIGGVFANSGSFTVNGVDRLNADGTSDATFNPGAGANSYVYAARAGAAGRVALAGAFTTVRGEARPGGLARLSATGASENLFTQTALASGYAFDVAERPDGKLLVRGSFTGVDGVARAALARFHSVPVRRGALVTALDGATLAGGDVRAVLPAADGGYVLAGEFTSATGVTRNRIVKVSATGALDATFAYTSGFNASVQGGELEPDGKFLFWGAFASYNGAGASGVVRVNADGTRDNGFLSPTFNSTVHAVVRLPDGKYLVAGAFTSADATTVGGLVRLNANGSLDAAFNAGAGANGAVLALARAGDGSIFAGGAFTTFAGASAPGVVKLTASGARAAGFDIGAGNPTTGNPVRALALQSDGKVLVGGSFTTFGGQTVARLIRLNPDGARDATFLGGFGADATVHSLVALADGRIFVGGAFTALGGGERRGLARLTAAGAIDPVFDVGAGFNNEVFAVTPLADGRVAVGGKFTTVSGVARNRFAVLYAGDEGAPSLGGSGELQTIEVNPGQGFTLSLGAPVAGLSYQWYRDGVLLAGATSSTYVVAAAALGDLGTYTTVVSNGGGEVTTTGTRVIVRLAPTVVSAPIAQAVGYGASATFSVSVSGPGPFTYQWFRNGEVISGQTADTLALTNAGDTDFGDTFFVRVTNAYGSFDTTPVALTFDPTAVPGALVRAFPTQAPVFTTAAEVMVRTSGGQFYVAAGSKLLRLNADGSTDASFAAAFSSASIRALAVQADGKLVVAGYVVPTGTSVSSAVVRLLPSGSIDPTFVAPTIDTFSVQALALQADGKAVIGGTFTAIGTTARRYLARLNTDGTLDTTFAPADDATGPNLNGFVRALLVQGANLIVAGDFTTYRGTTVNRLVRITTANVIDTTFLGGTRADGPVEALFAQADGKLFIRGAFNFYGGIARNRIARLNTNGSLDTAFDAGPGPRSASRFDTPTITDFAPGENNTLIVRGAFDSFSGWPAVNLVRLTATGAIDTQWGARSTANVARLLPTADGQLFVGGFFTLPGVTGTQYLARLLGGTFPPQPPSFIRAPQGNTFVFPAGSRQVLSGLATGPGTLTFQWFRDGVAVSDSPTVVGATTPILTLRSLRAAEAGAYTLRVTSSTHGATTSTEAQVNVGPEPTGPGSLDLTWAADPLSRSLLALGLAADGTAFAVGNDWDLDEYFVYQFNANGVLQPSTVFAQGTGFDSNPQALVRQSDGKVVVAGYFTTALGVARNYLARLNTNGSLDTAFNPAPNNPVVTLIAQSDGKLLVGGSFTTIAGANRTSVARLLATGAIDTTFVPGAHGLGEIKHLLIAADGKVYVIGRNNTTNTDDIVRLTSTGALDGTFARVSAPGSSIQHVALDSAGRLVVVGSFATIAGQTRNRIARLSATGTLDVNFGSVRSSGPSDSLARVLAAPDGYYYVVSDSSSGFTYDGFDLGPLVRLDANGVLDPNFPAPTATRFSNLFSASLAWVSNKLVVTTGSSWVRLNVDGGATGAPVVTASSGDRTVVEGLGVSLTARFGGTGPFTYVWRRAGTVITGATGPQLWLPNPTAADGGVYTVTATNGLGSATATMNLNFFAAEPLSPVAGIALGGNFNGAIRQVVRLADGGVLVGGDFRTVAGVNSPFVAKLKPDGTLDSAFAAALPFSTTSFGSLTTLAVEADGRILVHGSLTMADNSYASLVRLNANGSLAGTLLSSTNMNGAPAVMAVQADGKIVIAGYFTSVLGQPRAGLARLLANGTLDSTYQAGGIVSSSGIQAIHLDASGRVLLAGDFTSVGGVAASGRIVRLNLDGTLDANFRHTKVTGQISGFFRPSDGRLFVYGSSTLAQVGGTNVSVVQFDEAGDVVPTFVAPNQNAVSSMAEDLHGRLYLGQANALVRLLPGGLVDRTTSLGSGANVLLRADDRLLIASGSNLSTVNGFPVPGIAYLSVDGESPLALLASPARTVTASEGATLTLRAGVRGPAGTTYQWFRGSEAVAGATTPVLVLSGITPAASGDYTLVATHDGAQVTTVVSAVTVQGNLGRPGEIDLAWGAGRTVSGVGNMFTDAAGRIYLRGNVQVDGSPARGLVALDANGIVRADFTLSPRVTGQFQTVVPQPDGKLLIGGNASQLKLDDNAVALVRLNVDGSVDATFPPGVVSANGFVNQVHVLASGQILVMGSFTTYAGATASNVMRLSASGAVDPSFTGETSQGGAVQILFPAGEGKIWAIGSFNDAENFRRFFYRLNADGTRDTTFTTRPSYPVGSSSENIRRAVPAADGGFYLLTYRSGSPESSPLRRVTPQGDFDGAFQPGVFARTDFAAAATLSDIAVDASGRLLVVGQFSQHDGVVRNGVVRLLADGRPDLSFGAALPVLAMQSSAPNLVQVAGDRVLVYREALADYGGVNDRSGLYALDATELPAATPPVLTGAVSPVSLAAYDPLSLSLPVLAPAGATIQWFRNGVAIDGATATSYRLRGAGPADGGSYHATVQTTGGLLTVPAVSVTTPALGYSGALSARNAQVSIDGTIRFAVKQPDGRILVVSDGVFVNGEGPYELFRLNADGSFHSGLPTRVRYSYDSSTSVQAAVVDDTGRIYLGGSFNAVSGVTRNRIARLLADGTVDPAWDAGTGPNSTVNRLALTPDGKLVAGGSFSQVNGVARQFLARFGSNGAVDPTLVTGTSLNGVPLALHVQSDGRIVVGGNFTTYNGGTAVRLIRLETTGALDATFAPAPNAVVNTVIALADGRLLAGGNFSTIGGQSRTGLALLSAAGAVLEPALNFSNGFTALAEAADAGFFTLASTQVTRFSAAGVRDTVFTNANGYRGGFTNANTTPQSVNPTSLVAFGSEVLVVGPYVRSGNATRNGLAWLGTSESLAPVITSAPVNATLPEGGAVTWSVGVASTTGTLTYTWTKVGEGSVLSTNSSLARPNVTVADAGTYRVVVNNGEGAVEATVVLSVTPAPAATPGSPLLGFYAPTLSSGATVFATDAGKWWALNGSTLNRLLANGAVDPEFVAPTLTGGGISRLWRAPDGRLYVAGNFTAINGQPVKYLARFSAAGVFDPSFVAPFATLADTSITLSALAFASDGRIYVGGSFDGVSIAGRATNHLVRLLDSGAIDPAFDPLGGMSLGSNGNDRVETLAVLPDGRLLAGGTFTAAGGAARKGLVRFLPTGALDATFNNLDIQSVQQLEVLADGKLLVRGNFSTVDGANRPRLVRLSADGVVDPTFAISGITLNSLSSFLVRPDGRIVLFAQLNEGGTNRARVVQLLADGGVDPTFDYLHAYNVNATGTTGSVSSGVLLPDGNMLVSGSFSFIDTGVVRNGLVLVQGSPLAPVIVTPPQSATVAGGTAVTLSVTVSGTAPFSYQWRRGSTPIEGATTATYVLTSALVTDAGDYRVAVTNAAGTTLSAAATLTVTQSAQTITFAALSDVVFSATPISLEASASSGLAITFSVVSGPATINGSALTLTGPGTVMVRAAQAGNAAYLAASPVERTFTASAPLSGFAAWREGSFTAGERANVAVSGPNADPDRDGLPNLLEYALGLAPKTASTTGLPAVAVSATEWAYTYTRPADRSDVTYVVERSTSLTSWTTADVTHELVSTDAVAGTQTWRARVPLSVGVNAFFRLKVTAP